MRNERFCNVTVTTGVSYPAIAGTYRTVYAMHPLVELHSMSLISLLLLASREAGGQII